MSSALLKYYHRLPVPLRSVTASLRGLHLRHTRYGADTESQVQAALEREQWGADRWKAWREERLVFILRRAATQVPYYREHWNERRRRGDQAPVELLENWPILRKETVREHGRSFVADDCDPRRMIHEQTSGTTGKPLNFWLSRESVRAWYALSEARWRRWYGLDRKDRWAMLGGQLVTPAAQTRPPFWVWNAGMSQLYLSSYHLSRENATAYIDAMRRYKVTYLLGYASAMYSLARFALELGLNVSPMRIAISNAEPLYEHQREAIAAAFQCPVRDTYGMSEAVCAGSECEAGVMHLWPEAGVIEVLTENTDKHVQGGATGRLVCTGLLNPGMPLIRYEVGDRGALYQGRAACDCGRTLPRLLKVEGRMDDVLVTPDGRQIGRLDPVFKADAHIREAQIIQERIDFVRVLIVIARGYTAKDGRAIAQRLRDRVGDVEVAVEIVDSIPRTSNGKFRAVVSNIRTAAS